MQPPAAPAQQPPGPPEGQKKVITFPEKLVQFLRGRPEPLFAVLDGARDPEVGNLLANTSEPHVSLFQGPEGEKLKEFGPWLVALTGREPLLESLIYSGWGKAWGYFLHSAAPLPALRDHLRQLLKVDRGDGKKLFFRFYDPRVVKTFLPTCDAGQLQDFFGPVSALLVEHDDPETVIEFRVAAGKLAETVRPLPLEVVEPGSGGAPPQAR